MTNTAELKRMLARQKWKFLFYFFFVIGFVELNYQQLNGIIRSVSAPPKPIHLVRRRATETSVNTQVEFECEYDSYCNQGTCTRGPGNISYCECDLGYLSLNEDGEPASYPCDYKQLKAVTMFLISFFAGLCGVDCKLPQNNS